MQKNSIYKFFENEEENPFAYYNPFTCFEYDCWNIEYYFEINFNNKRAYTWYKLLGKEFLDLLPGNLDDNKIGYGNCKQKIKGDVFKLFWKFLYSNAKYIDQKFYNDYLEYQPKNFDACNWKSITYYKEKIQKLKECESPDVADALEFLDYAHSVFDMQFAYSRFTALLNEDNKNKLIDCTKILLNFLKIKFDPDIAFQLVSSKYIFCKCLDFLKEKLKEEQDKVYWKHRIENSIFQLTEAIPLLDEIKHLLLIHHYNIEPDKTQNWEMSEDYLHFENKHTGDSLDCPYIHNCRYNTSHKKLSILTI